MAKFGTYLLPDEGGYDVQISYLVTQLKYVRSKTVSLVENLDVEQLDYFCDDISNSIGILLKHIAALEANFQASVFEKRLLSTKERAFWYGSLPGEMYLRIVNGNDIQYYLNLLEEVRITTYEKLKERDDNWLLSPSYHSTGPWNPYWVWMHQMEDECNHLGQIKVIKNHYKSNQEEKEHS